MGNHESFLNRIQKTLYYGRLPNADCLSLPVTELASELFSEPHTGRSLDRLHCKDAAYISRQSCVSPCSFVLAVLYLERLKSCNPEYLQCVAPSELFLVSLMVSTKFLHDYGDDTEIYLDEWAASGGITVKELISLEKDFLNAIEWEIFVSDQTFWRKLSSIESIIGRNEGKNRGFFTYTELNNLLSVIDAGALVHYLTAVLAVLTLTYAAGLLTVISSMLIVSHMPGNCLSPVSSEVPSNQQSFEQEPETVFEKKPIDAVDILQTGIILASIAGANYDSNETDNTESVGWDWWNSTTMNWLTSTSKIMEIPIPEFKAYTYNNYLEMTIDKKLLLQDQLHKATRIRMQDRLESSWHTEWTDTIFTLFSYSPMAFFQQIKE